MTIHTTKCDKCGKTCAECAAESAHAAVTGLNASEIHSIFEPAMIRVTMPGSPWWSLGMTATQAQKESGFDFCSQDCLIAFFSERVKAPNGTSSATAEGWRGGCAAGSAGSSRRDSPEPFAGAHG